MLVEADDATFNQIVQRSAAVPAVAILWSSQQAQTRALLDALTRDGRGGLYAPLDISREVLLETAGQLREEYPSLVVEPAVADFHHLPPLAGGPGQRLLAFLGGTIGNFEEEERSGFLRMVRTALDPGDHLLLGADLPTGSTRHLPGTVQGRAQDVHLLLRWQPRLGQ